MYLRIRTLPMILAAAFVVPAIAAVPAATPVAPASTEEASHAPSATLELASEQMRLIAGGSAGKGVLHFGGHDYKFTFKSASAGVGGKIVTGVTATGEVFGLDKVEDFAGSYKAITTSVIAGSATTSVSYSNSAGVKVVLHAKVKGAGVSFGAGTATIKLVK